ncbi:hypothetical protein [Moheibacter sediminis]|uniref:Uncharacterized protein n=1 Tax=Moheibacter sediminis TaxID=1434700 RepID=A0A1W2C5H4_9FLAO|nr:hypothetical protein [Moheibacter sediminis]SMC80400.1 hypothetical protein SAMN06296427_108155 [Moheibacter sediminis]
MKKALSTFLVLFLLGIGLSNEKTTETLNSGESFLFCFDMFYSANNTTDQLTYSSSPSGFIGSGGYIEISISDLCSNLVYYEYKTMSPNSGVINKSSFAGTSCSPSGINQDYILTIVWYVPSCGVRSTGGLINL